MSTPIGGGEVSRMDSFKAQMKKALILFVVFDLLFIAGAVLLYFKVFQPQMVKVEVARDEALRGGVALQARARSIEARYALTLMDVPGAKLAAGDVLAQLTGLAARVPADRTQEAAEVKQLVDRAALVQAGFDVDPNGARKDLERIEARLATLYPAIPSPLPAKR